MQPALAFPFHDPDGTMFHHWQAILPDLKKHFERAYLCPSLSTWEHVDHMRQLQADDFFTIFPIKVELQIGQRLTYLYQRAAEQAPVDQIIHLCFLDRLSFAVEGEYQESFFADIDSLGTSDVPLIFQRSERAWETHPQNYREIEGIITTLGRHLFGRELDYAWCHIAICAGQLREIMPFIINPDLSMVGEIVFYLQDHIQTKDVDWLSWEDPFILGRDPIELRNERENSIKETHKRLSYILPMIDILTKRPKPEPRKIQS
jgi:hypothetical protein